MADYNCYTTFSISYLVLYYFWSVFRKGKQYRKILLFLLREQSVGLEQGGSKRSLRKKTALWLVHKNRRLSFAQTAVKFNPITEY